MKFLLHRIALANTYKGGVVITGVILIFGYSTPKLMRLVAKGLARIAD